MIFLFILWIQSFWSLRLNFYLLIVKLSVLMFYFIIKIVFSFLHLIIKGLMFHSLFHLLIDPWLIINRLCIIYRLIRTRIFFHFAYFYFILYLIFIITKLSILFQRIIIWHFIIVKLIFIIKTLLFWFTRSRNIIQSLLWIQLSILLSMHLKGNFWRRFSMKTIFRLPRFEDKIFPILYIWWTINSLYSHYVIFFYKV